MKTISVYLNILYWMDLNKLQILFNVESTPVLFHPDITNIHISIVTFTLCIDEVINDQV